MGNNTEALRHIDTLINQLRWEVDLLEADLELLAQSAFMSHRTELSEEMLQNIKLLDEEMKRLVNDCDLVVLMNIQKRGK